MSTHPVHWIGYGTLHEMLRSIDTNVPEEWVYVTIARKYDGGIPNLARLSIMVQYIDARDRCHYWYMRLADVMFFDGKPASPHEEALVKSAHRAYDFIRDYLIGGGWTVAEAQVAMPKDLRTFEGGTDLLFYDRATGWRPATEEDRAEFAKEDA